MKFKDVIDSPCGLRYMFEELELQSAASRGALLESEIMTDRDSIERAFSKIIEFERVFTNKSDIRLLQEKLKGLKDIFGTLSRLKSGAILDEVALFEVKELALISGEVGEILDNLSVKTIKLPSLATPLSILDPEGQRIRSFFIYDCYSPELKRLRDLLREKPADKDELFISIMVEEHRLRGELSQKLREHADPLHEALTKLVEADITLAKVLQKSQMQLNIPKFSEDGMTTYKGLFHPQVKELLSKKGCSFQSVDIGFGVRPTTIIGANMGGKTVVLKMVALSQYLFQFGFAIPATDAGLDIKERIMLFIGEEESYHHGLSSFATEVVRINEIIALARQGSRNLALVDEPARTTNPVEGTALVSALISVMSGLNTDLIVTTHYNLGATDSRKLKVRGLIDGKMDYALLETSDSQVPREALNIAHSLNADEGWLAEADRVLKSSKL